MSDLLRPRNCARHPRKAKRSPQEFAIATWNVRGITATSKKETLGTDCDHYNIDLGCIQETKVEGMLEQQLHTGHRLILMQQKTATYRGLGFIIGPRLLDHVLSFAYISDCVTFIDLSLPLKNGATTKCRVIKAQSHWGTD